MSIIVKFLPLARSQHRVRPEDVTINIARGEKAPLAPAGHRWKGLVHNKKATWLAFWKDNINDHFKYVFLHASSVFKGQSDWEKYEKARELKKHIGKIRADYMRDLASADFAKAQRATAMYLIDQFALRVGCVRGGSAAHLLDCHCLSCS
jgi:DNA topoisomerase-1